MHTACVQKVNAAAINSRETESVEYEKFISIIVLWGMKGDQKTTHIVVAKDRDSKMIMCSVVPI